MNEVGVGSAILLGLAALSFLVFLSAMIAQLRGREPRFSGGLTMLCVLGLFLVFDHPVRWVDEYFRSELPQAQADLVIPEGRYSSRVGNNSYLFRMRNGSDWVVTGIWGAVEVEFEDRTERIEGLLPFCCACGRDGSAFPGSKFTIIDEVDFDEDPIDWNLEVVSLRGYLQ